RRHTTTARSHFLPHDPDADHAALHQLALDCERFSPFVGWQTLSGASSAPTPTSPTSHRYLLLDVTGIGRLFGSEEILAQQLIDACRAQQYWGRVAIGPTIGAAWACAMFPRRQINSQPPNSLQPTIEILTPETLPQALADRPVTALRLSPETVELLRQLGIHQIAQLQTIPRSALTSRLGPQLLQRLDQAQGLQLEQIEPLRPPPRYQVDYCLEEPTQDVQVLELLAERLLVDLTRELSQRSEGILRLDVRLDCAGHAPIECSVGLFRPTASPRHILQLLTTQWEQRRWSQAIGRLQLRATLTATLETRQGLLFADHDRSLDSERQLGDLLERLSSRLGLTAVLRPKLRREALPESAFTYEPAVGGKRSARPKPSAGSKRPAHPTRTTRAARTSPAVPAAPSALDPIEELASLGPLGSVAARPCELRHPPEAIAVVALAHDGPPASFQWQQQPWRVTRYWGPERIETGWWRGPSRRRDYYRVETSSGQRFWLYRDLVPGPTHLHWFLHGLFS
ncbi:MAG: Y-family DNA polymerase, partial [Planctomycetota bacterium]